MGATGTRVRAGTDPLAAVAAGLRATGADGEGLAPGLVVADPAGWLPATELTGAGLDLLITAATSRWDAPPHAAVAQMWKAYTYWVLLPVVHAWQTCRRVPLLTAGHTLLRLDTHCPVVVGARPGTGTAMLAGDPLAGHGTAVTGEDALPEVLRHAVLDAHLHPVLEALHHRTRLGRRTLRGLVASGAAHALIRSADLTPREAARTLERLLTALDCTGLTEIVTGRDGRPAVRRRTCCLAYTLSGRSGCTSCATRSA